MNFIGTLERSFAVFLIGIALTAAGCAGAPQRPLDVAALDAELRRLERRGFVGQVLVARGDRVLFSAGYGQRAPGAEDPVTTGTVFPLASLTKPFTASAVLALAADGRLRLDDPVGRYLPSLEAPWAEIPVHALLTHGAGLPAEIHNRAWAGRPQFEPVGRAAFLERVQAFPPDHPPGEGFNYSNVGYGLLGAVIETVTGRSWEEYLHERLLEPAGVAGIGFLRPGFEPEALAVGREGGRPWGTFHQRPSLADGLGWHLRASGDLHASADAIHDWWRAIVEGRWLDAEWLDAWMVPRVTEPDGTMYGYGWHFRETRRGRVIGHTGGNGVFAVDFSWIPDRDLLIYVATAEADFQADVIRDRLHRRLFGGF